MTKNHGILSEVITNPKYAFPKSSNRPTKRSQHRYGRRKVKECLHWGRWEPAS